MREVRIPKAEAKLKDTRMKVATNVLNATHDAMQCNASFLKKSTMPSTQP
jgi:hypothetical protein